MSTHPTFDRNPKGNFHPGNNYSQVVVGTGSLLLEDDLNEMQAILNHRIDKLYDAHEFDGLKSSMYWDMHPTRPDTMIIPPFTAQVAGHTIRVSGIGNDGSAPEFEDGSNFVTLLGSYSVFYLEVHDQVVAAQIDPRIQQETSRRAQLQFTLRNISLSAILSFALKMDMARDPEGAQYKYDQNGRWRSENGYYAVPIFEIRDSTNGVSKIVLTAPYTNLYYENGNVKSVYKWYGGKKISQTDLSYDASGEISAVTTIQDNVKRKFTLQYESDGIRRINENVEILKGER